MTALFILSIFQSAFFHFSFKFLSLTAKQSARFMSLSSRAQIDYYLLDLRGG